MQQLQEILHSGECNCVVRKDSEIRTFNERGIAALHSLLNSEPTLLDGAEIADTIVGKGAAALMVKGGVKSLYAEVISQSGLKPATEFIAQKRFFDTSKYITSLGYI